VDDALHVDPDLGLLEALDALPAQMAMRKEGEDVARDLREDGVVVPARERHRQTWGIIVQDDDLPSLAATLPNKPQAGSETRTRALSPVRLRPFDRWNGSCAEEPFMPVRPVTAEA
jgi:hypothetical protein